MMMTNITAMRVTTPTSTSISTTLFLSSGIMSLYNTVNVVFGRDRDDSPFVLDEL